MLMLKLGFRNLFRNRRRSLLTGFAVGLGLACLILMDGFWLGMIDNMVKTATSSYLGHAQVHHQKYSESFDPEYYISSDSAVFKKIKGNQDVESMSSRVITLGMVSSSQDSQNVRVLGVIPSDESKLSKFKSRILEGTYLEDEKSLMIGQRLKDKLSVELGDRIVLTVSEVETGELKQELFRLSGIFGMGSKEIDEGMVLIHQKRLQGLLGNSGFHELALKFKDLSLVSKNKSFVKSLNSEDRKAETWKELVPQVVGMIKMSDSSIGILGFVLFALVAMGILNTMFMSLFERSYEFGVLRAVGTKKSELLVMICSEAFALGLISSFFGIIIAAALGYCMMVFGLDYTGIEFGEVTFTEKIYFIFTAKQFSFYPLVLIAFTVIISLYPALKTLRVKTAQALHRSL